MSAADNAFAEQQAKAVTQIANVSKLLRDAIAASLPVAPEQYLTVSIPGTTIDTRHIKNGGTFVWDNIDTAFIPMQVQQEESKLVDNMIPLSYIMIGNTGKSVARSYSRALDKLVARKATIKTGEGEQRSPGNADYDKAMTYLTTPNPQTRRTPVEDYVEKQKEWATAQDQWDLAKKEARADAIAAYPADLVKQAQYYNEWNQTHYRKFKFAVQGRYMDWVANGHKFNVEHNFGTVDVDSVMALIESSKESIRNSTIIDADGSNEVFLVNLTPKNWATLCKQKAEGWFQRNGEYSLDQLDAEIERLHRLRLSYEAMASTMGINMETWVITETPKYPVSEPGTAPDVGAADSTLRTAFGSIYEKEAALATANNKLRDMSPDERKAELDNKDSEFNKATDELKKQRGELATAIDANRQKHSDWTKWATASLNDDKAKAGMVSWIRGVLSDLDKNVQDLTAKREAKAKNSGVPPVAAIQGADGDPGSNGTDQAPDGAEQPDPVFGVGKNASSDSGTTTPGAGAGAGGGSSSSAGKGTAGPLPVAGSISDPWVTITASFSASDQSSTEDTSSWGFSVGGGAGWGLWSVGGSYSHDQSSSDFSSDMASCDVSVSFSALVVNVQRPWLYGEVFADTELDVATGERLSPGPRALHELMRSQKDKADRDPLGSNQRVVNDLAAYSAFPAYPTSFIVAADTTVDFHGNTSHVEKHFSAQSNAGSASVGWGPFSVSSSFHQSSSHQSFQCQSTATGCRLIFGAPQVIGWVSQILPELPRTSGFVPMVQNIVK